MPARTIRLRLTPARTIRLRLTLTYGIVFLVTGAVFLTIGYLVVRHNLAARPDFRDELRRLGLPPGPQHPHVPFGFGPGSLGRRAFAAAHAQLVDDALRRLVIEYVLALLAMTGVSVLAGWLLAGRVLGPLREITATARRVSGENLGERIALVGPADELKDLADTFDRMLARLDSAFASQRHFVASASHELRTPLAIMRTELDVALADPNADADELRTMGEAVRDTVDRSEGLIEALLVLARSEALTGREEVVDLAELAAACVTDLTLQAQNLGLEVRTELKAARVQGEPNLLERMIGNLIDNAIRYNAPGGHLRVRTWAAAEVHVAVANGGEVIDPEAAGTLTEPFRRLDRNVGGFGLGLSIVRSVAEAHGGTVALNAPVTGGLEVHVTLPPAPRPGNVESSRRFRSLTKS